MCENCAMKKLSEPARKLIVENANKLIANNHSREVRMDLKKAFTDLLIVCDSYRGFNYIGWLDGGHAKWIADGKPDDNEPYLGDITMIRFY